MTDASKNVAFIGIGKMGLPMSVLVTKAGFSVTAFDQSAAVEEVSGAAASKLDQYGGIGAALRFAMAEGRVSA